MKGPTRPIVSGTNRVDDRCDTFVAVIIMTFSENAELLFFLKDNQNLVLDSAMDCKSYI